MLTAPVDNIIVKLNKAFEDEIVFESGVKLFKDTGINPEWSTTCTGTVVSIPKRLSNRHELRGLDIEDLKPGDEIIFSYMVVFDMEQRERDTPVHNNMFYHEGAFYWKVDYHQYFGKIEDGKIVPAQGYVFLQELEPPAEPQGLIWMPEMVQKARPKGKARVVAVGRSKAGETPLSVKEGDIARYSDRYACKYEIKGNTYILLHHHQVLATEA